MKKLLSTLLFCLMPVLAYAQTGNEFDTPTAGKKTVGTVNMCLNASGLAVPISSGACANTQPVADANVGAPGATICASDTASCVLNAPIQRLLLRIGDLITVAGNPAKLCDNVSCDATHTVDVLAASTAAPASAIPLVVALHPSSPTPAPVSNYPAGAIPIEANQTKSDGTAATATLAASTTLKTYICAFSIRANATAAATSQSSVSGFTTTLNFLQWTAPNANGIGITEEVFIPCKPSSAINTAITVTSAAPGSGGQVSAAAWGYQAP